VDRSVAEKPLTQFNRSVMVNFYKLSWPHVSVATLVPEGHGNRSALCVDVNGVSSGYRAIADF
jgi:hypothetical protein